MSYTICMYECNKGGVQLINQWQVLILVSALYTRVKPLRLFFDYLVCDYQA